MNQRNVVLVASGILQVQPQPCDLHHHPGAEAAAAGAACKCTACC